MVGVNSGAEIIMEFDRGNNIWRLELRSKGGSGEGKGVGCVVFDDGGVGLGGGEVGDVGW